MSIESYSTYQEIKSQSSAWEQALQIAQAVSLPAPCEQVLFTGCGSTYYLSLAAASLYQELTGRPARAVPAGELLFNPRTCLTDQATLLVCLSRSGTTTETVHAARRFKEEKGGPVVVISNYGRALAELADISLEIPRGQEDSVAQTRSFSSMLVAVTAWCARMAERQDLLEAMNLLPAAGLRLLQRYEPLARDLGEDLGLDRFYFLGSGARYGLACELNLKMKEMTLTHSEPFHFLEFRHGPMSMVNEHALVAGLLSEANRGREHDVLEEMKALGGRTLSLGESQADICLESDVPEAVRGVMYLPILQLAALYRSLAKGLNPDRPNNLTAVVQFDL